MTLKAMAHCAEMRTNLNLMNRSPTVPSSLVHDARSQLLHDLARGNLIYPKSMAAVGLRPKMKMDERKQVLNIKSSLETPDENQVAFQDLLAKFGRKAMESNWIWRIGQEARDMAEKGWYGFFVTLTVDPARCPDSEEMWKEGREFRIYLRKLAREAAEAMGHHRAIQEGASVHEYVRHVAVIEHGKSRHHHHMHALIHLRAVPEIWKKDPNRGVRDASRRTQQACKPMHALWPWSAPGLGEARYFRCEGDAWTKLGFCIPVNKMTGRTVKVRAPEAAGFYLAKYMGKENKAWTHRVKATRNLGTERLRAMIARLSLAKVQALQWRPRTYPLSISVQATHSVPVALMRSLAKQETFVRKWASKSLDFVKVLNQNSDAFQRMLQSVKDGQKPHKMVSREFYEWVTEHLPVPEGYCEKKLLAAHKLFAYEFPPPSRKTVQHLGANIVSS